ncbi:hypothetical protein N7U66_15430 [Lacinutrix neustonica]|uniref:Uncharacterized protein n=1 Tax=Lacinutrix neustonica TaxID=2980107 RepID=A0A9E8MUY4_9FLAO|nr:hypothetical protein [Lacinutrix neustonica]WAC01420.1 hypothetical protein N7U66_15430 [Lacinutrix neustonica]
MIYEYLELNDLILNNIPTIADKGELLESKGVYRIEFRSDSTYLKGDKTINVELNNDDYVNYLIFKGDTIEKGNFVWKEEGELFSSIMYPFNGDPHFHMIREVPIDSLVYYENYRDSIYKINNVSEFDKINNDILYSFSMNSNIWINVDKLIETPLEKDFEIKCKQIDLYEDYVVYVIYENMNSFTSFYLTSDNLTLNQLPIVGNARSFIVTYSDDKILYDEFLINEKTNP